jgi:hypothetical protein
MADYILTVPEDVVAQARQFAADTAQPVDKVLIDHLRTLSAPMPALPPDEEAELEALRHLSSDALWTIAREQLPDSLQARLQTLMDQNSAGSITPDGYAELAALVERGQRLLLRKSEAAALLTQRGYKVTPQAMLADE